MASVVGPQQICFLNEEGQMVCNFIWKNGKPVFSKSGHWFKFWPKKKKRVARAST